MLKRSLPYAFGQHSVNLWHSGPLTTFEVSDRGATGWRD